MAENIPYNTARRVMENNSQQENYVKDKDIFSKHLLSQGYSKEIISDSFERVENCYGEGEAFEKNWHRWLYGQSNTKQHPYLRVLLKSLPIVKFP